MKLGDGLFLRTFREVAETYYKSSGIAYNDMIVDNTYAFQTLHLSLCASCLCSVPCSSSRSPNNSTSW